MNKVEVIVPTKRPFLVLTIGDEFTNTTTIVKTLYASNIEEVVTALREALAGVGYAQGSISDVFGDDV